MVIPRIKFEIDETAELSGVKTISLVDEPAIESSFVYFAKNLVKPSFIELKSEGLKQVVAGLALIPDKDILRYDEQGNPYYGFFTVESIERIRNKFHKEGLTHSVNTDHSSTSYIDAYLLESFIIDSEERLADVKAKGIEEATLGSWFVSYKIEDKETFERVKSGNLNGFSIEIFLQKFHKVDNNNLNKYNKAMTIVEKIKALLLEAEGEQTPAPVETEAKKFESAKTIEGDVEVMYTEVGQPVLIKDAEGKEVPAPDGEHKLDNNKTIKVESGALVSIEDTKEEPAPAAEDQSKVKAVETELNKVKEDFSKASTDLATAKTEIENLKAEIEKLKKAPITNPIVKTEKVETVDESKLSNFEKEKLRLKLK